ncbi:MAG: hybrid sensor histidine kinase/response regulator [Desulfobacteraceae bacterium]|nr:hybrid sensor histidine kinase/response regulator [Desulfobacteraceae bacterium]
MSGKILLVDDEEDFIAALAEKMVLRGMEVSQTTSPAKAIEMLDRESFDAVILDLLMPQMDGLEVLKAIKKLRPETQVILLTGNATLDKGIEAMKLGAMDLLEKPLDFQKLTGRLNEARANKLILEKERMEQRLRSFLRMASLGELAVGVAHEINNPLAAIREAAGWIKDLLADDEAMKISPNLAEIAESLKLIEVHCLRCKDITAKLLSFARSRDKEEAEKVEIGEVIKEVLETFNYTKRTNITVVTHVAPSIPPIVAAATEMLQVMRNLVDNAVDAIGEKNGQIMISAEGRGDWIIVEVKDTGPGVPEAVKDRLFEPFFTTKPVGKGTGLGLYICYGIVKRLKGDIVVKSEEGKGACITVTLPIHGTGDLISPGSFPEPGGVK